MNSRPLGWWAWPPTFCLVKPPVRVATPGMRRFVKPVALPRRRSAGWFGERMSEKNPSSENGEFDDVWCSLMVLELQNYWTLEVQNIFLEFEVGVSLFFSFVLCGLMVYKLVMVISGRCVLFLGSRIQIYNCFFFPPRFFFKLNITQTNPERNAWDHYNIHFEGALFQRTFNMTGIKLD